MAFSEFSSCYLNERNPTLPFSQKARFEVGKVHYTLTVTGKVNATPTEFEINIRDSEDRDTVYFQMHQRWVQNVVRNAVFNTLSENQLDYPEYAHFPSLKPGSYFTITISTVKEARYKPECFFEVRVNDDPVYWFRYRETEGIEDAEFEIRCPNNDISVSLIKVNQTYPED